MKKKNIIYFLNYFLNQYIPVSYTHLDVYKRQVVVVVVVVVVMLVDFIFLHSVYCIECVNNGFLCLTMDTDV